VERGACLAGFGAGLGWPEAIRATGATLMAILSVSKKGKHPSAIRQASSNPKGSLRQPLAGSEMPGQLFSPCQILRMARSM